MGSTKEKWDLETEIKKKFKNTSTKALIRKMEKAPDFGYDDEAYELSRRLKAMGKTWRWGAGTWETPDLIIVEDAKR